MYKVLPMFPSEAFLASWASCGYGAGDFIVAPKSNQASALGGYWFVEVSVAQGYEPDREQLSCPAFIWGYNRGLKGLSLLITKATFS